MSRKPTRRFICKDEPDGMALEILVDPDGAETIAINQYDWGLRNGISDKVIVPSAAAARSMAGFLMRYADWQDRDDG